MLMSMFGMLLYAPCKMLDSWSLKKLAATYPATYRLDLSDLIETKYFTHTEDTYVLLGGGGHRNRMYNSRTTEYNLLSGTKISSTLKSMFY